MSDVSGKISFGINIDTKSIKHHIRYIEMVMKQFHHLFVKYMTAENVKADLLEKTIQVITKAIYESYNPQTYKRTFDLLNSFKVDSNKREKAKPHLWIYSDPAVASSWSDPNVSYAAYFEDKRFRSFLLNKGEGVVPIRPFFHKMEKAFEKVLETGIPDYAEKALQEIQDRIFK